ncbi:MAG TPA: AzlC family ABC transporter permease [Ilumatobacter sp.]|nr:AzlC family ABC transporter permease [Ilumatobacter sp.]
MAIRDSVPFIVSAIPFGFVVGLAITESAMPAWVAWLSNPLVFAGAAQLTVITLAGTASLWALISAGLVINARHIMYSAAMAPTFQKQPAWFRWVGPMFLIDQTFALASTRLDDEPRTFRRYFLTAGVFLWCNWLVMTGLGMLVGPIVPESWRLEFAIPIMFLGVVLAGLKQLPHAVAAIAGGAVGLVASGLPDRLGILVGAFAGIAAGTATDVWCERRRPTNASELADDLTAELGTDADAATELST